MKNEILKVIRYFDFFDYPPNLSEIHRFLRIKISRKKLESFLKSQLSIVSCQMLYCLKGREKLLKLRALRKKITDEKIHKIKNFLRLLKFFPQIKLIGLSGTMAMMHAAETDDIDLFIITAKNRLFTARFIAVCSSIIFGLKRKRRVRHDRDKVCLNLFFDSGDLVIPKFKRSEYVAHEVLQMKPIFSRGKIYERFLKANEWIYKIFPNSKVKMQNAKSQVKIQNFKFLIAIFNFSFLIFNLLEELLKFIQLFIIRSHQTTEIITPTQLWFHPVDFGKKLKNNFE